MILVGDLDKQLLVEIWYQILGSISEFNIGLVRSLAESFEMLSDASTATTSKCISYLIFRAGRKHHHPAVPIIYSDV